MKRTILAIVAIVLTFSSACAQKLQNIRVEARYITDKMVAELGLTTVQRNSILQLNIDYLNGINGYRDIHDKAWKYRNKQIRKMLNSRQWKRYRNASYFYQPIGWERGTYVHNIYLKYPDTPKRGHDKGPRFDESRPPRFDEPKGPHGNNSPEAIKMRRDMRKHCKRGAR